MRDERDSLGSYVKERLEQWGEVFALSKDREYLGYASKNLIARLIEYEGDLPQRSVGFKPLEIDQAALEVEEAVFEISKHAPIHACVLRAYYCGQGRRKFERWDQANELLVKAGLPKVSLPSYMDLARLGTERVHGILLARAMGG